MVSQSALLLIDPSAPNESYPSPCKPRPLKDPDNSLRDFYAHRTFIQFRQLGHGSCLKSTKPHKPT